MSNEEALEKDYPIFRSDFQIEALNLNTSKGIGSRLYGDVCLRGYLYPAAKRLHENLELRTIDRQKLGDRPEEILEIHYFGNQTDDLSALSFHGLKKVFNKGYLDDIIQTTNPKRYNTRLKIIQNVLVKKLEY